jgi:hypothetical protein
MSSDVPTQPTGKPGGLPRSASWCGFHRLKLLKLPSHHMLVLASAIRSDLTGGAMALAYIAW